MRRTAVLVALLLVLAGCSGQPAVSMPENPQSASGETTNTQPVPSTATTTDESVQRIEVVEQGASLGDVNATKVWQRVGDLVSPDLPESPPTVYVQPYDPNETYTPTPFRRSLGAENHTARVEGSILGRYNPWNGTVTVRREPNAADDEVESVLAHEFAHALQHQQLMGHVPSHNNLGAGTVVEGAAEYVEWRYADRFNTTSDRPFFTQLYASGPPAWKLASAEYYLGAKWVRNHSSDAPLAETYRNQPQTAEEVLHGLPPGSEPPRNLTVYGETGEYGIHVPRSATRSGEAELRYLLEYGLTREQAARAAAGWGDDRRLTFQSVEGDGWAWVVRWDSADEASEFERLFSVFRGNVSEPLRLEVVGNETTVVFSGRAAFVENATVFGTAENVTVAAGD